MRWRAQGQWWVWVALAVGCGTGEGEPADDGDAHPSTGGGPTSSADDDGPGDDADPSEGGATEGGATGEGRDDGDDDDGTGGSDGGGSDGETTGEPRDETIPVFVAVGDGGFFATSCDRGASWTHTAFSDVIDDHSPWAAFGGIAFGADRFVAGFGWGAPGSLMWSSDGLVWEALQSDAFEVDGRATPYDSWTAAVAHNGLGFVTFAQRVWGSVGGHHWTPKEIELPPGSDQIRQLRGFAEPALLVASLESQAGEGHPPGNFVVVSDDDGETWVEGVGYDEACSFPIQHEGDIEAHGDTVLVAASALCRSTDHGHSWTPLGSPTGATMQDVFADDAGVFWVVSGTRLFRSDDDGVDWSPVADLGADLAAAEYGGGRYVAVGARGDAFFHSDDGETWMPADLDWRPDGQTWVRDLAVGGLVGGCFD